MKSSPEVHGHAAANEAGPIDGVSKMLVCLGSAETALCMEVTIPPSDTFPLRQDICSGKCPRTGGVAPHAEMITSDTICSFLVTFAFKALATTPKHFLLYRSSPI
jgi:hypothetical protein